MKAKTLYSLIAAALLALIAAWWVNSSQKPASETAEKPAQLVPGLREQLNDINAITITGAENKVLATLRRGADGWTIAEKAGYPADLTKLREFLIKLADATVLEQKTSNPKLGVVGYGRDVNGLRLGRRTSFLRVVSRECSGGGALLSRWQPPV